MAAVELLRFMTIPDAIHLCYHHHHQHFIWKPFIPSQQAHSFGAIVFGYSVLLQSVGCHFHVGFKTTHEP